MAGGLRQRIATHRATGRALGAALVLATVPYWEVLLGNRSAMYGDVNDLTVPQYVEVWDAIKAGHGLWWTPSVFAGHSMVGSGQFAVFYPLNVVFGFLEPVTAYRWWLLGHLWIATAGAFAWSWRRFGSRTGALVSGIAYSGCGFAVMHLVHSPFVIAVAWLPVAFMGIDVVRERWSTRGAALVAVPVALIAFGGQPQMLWIALVGVGSYALVLAVLERDPIGLASCAGAVALGVGIAAVQLLPLWRFSRTSQRPSLSMAAAFEFAELPRHLVTTVFPWSFGGASQGSVFSAPWTGGAIQHEVGALFVGATIVALAVVAITREWRDAAVRALVAMSVLALLVALGGSTPFGRFVYNVVPLARSFRAWGRTALLLNLAFAMLAGLGVRELRRAPERAVLWLGGAVVALGAAALALPHLGFVQQQLAGGAYGIVARGLPVAFLLGLAAAVAVMALHPRVGAAALVLICALELVSFAYPAEWRSQSGPVDVLEDYYDASRPPSFGLPHDAPGGIDRWVTDTYTLRMLSLVKDMDGINGYDPLMQREWTETAAGFAYDGYPTRPAFQHIGILSLEFHVDKLSRPLL